MRLVFMGTPEFGIPTLRRLFESRHNVVGVVTRPDRPKGRGLKITGSAVKRQALRFDLPVLQPENLRDTGFIRSLKDFHADCFVVVGFRIMPVELFALPPKGAINLHASLLPKYRGAAPIQWALIHGEKETGVSVFFIEEKVDTGKLILQNKVPIREDEDAGALHDKMAEVGARAILKALDLIENGKVKPSPQRGTPTPAPKILPQHCQIRWDQYPNQIINLIRGLSPSPGAFTLFKGKRIKIFKATIVNGDLKMYGKPGEILDVQKEGLVVAAKKGNVRILELQIEGKRRMKVDAFIRGYPISAGMAFGTKS
jgi:methionyl-tRNA formyltransferase